MPYELFDSRTKKPIVDDDSEPLAYDFKNAEPQNGDFIEIDGVEYTIQRVWTEDGELALRLTQASGIVLC